MTFKNINKSKRIKKSEKRLRRLQRKVSRKYELNKEGRKLVKTSNIIKLEKQIRLLYRKLSNIRNNHLHQATNKIVKTKPSKTCSKCGYIKSKLSLSERAYICEECGAVIDRDFNASINLSRYSA